MVGSTHTPAKLVGHVYAPDEETALRSAVEHFGIEKPWRNRLWRSGRREATRAGEGRLGSA